MTEYICPVEGDYTADERESVAFHALSAHGVNLQDDLESIPTEEEYEDNEDDTEQPEPFAGDSDGNVEIGIEEEENDDPLSRKYEKEEEEEPEESVGFSRDNVQQKEPRRGSSSTSHGDEDENQPSTILGKLAKRFLSR